MIYIIIIFGIVLLVKRSLKYRNIRLLILICLLCFRLVHTLNSEICVCGHSINYEDEAECRYFYSVWDLNEKMCIREIDVHQSEADFYGEFACPN